MRLPVKLFSSFFISYLSPRLLNQPLAQQVMNPGSISPLADASTIFNVFCDMIEISFRYRSSIAIIRRIENLLAFGEPTGEHHLCV